MKIMQFILIILVAIVQQNYAATKKLYDLNLFKTNLKHKEINLNVDSQQTGLIFATTEKTNSIKDHKQQISTFIDDMETHNLENRTNTVIANSSDLEQQTTNNKRKDHEEPTTPILNYNIDDMEIHSSASNLENNIKTIASNSDLEQPTTNKKHDELIFANTEKPNNNLKDHEQHITTYTQPSIPILNNIRNIEALNSETNTAISKNNIGSGPDLGQNETEDNNIAFVFLCNTKIICFQPRIGTLALKIIVG